MITTTDGDSGGREIPTVVLLLAVSGGRDSVALFHAVTALTSKATNNASKNGTIYHIDIGKDAKMTNVQCELHVAHFNHEQRGDSSDGDELFVKRLCRERDIPFHNFMWSDEQSIPTKANQSNNDELCNKYSFTQDTARQWRRRKLIDLLSELVLQTNNSTTPEESRWGAILTAHHGDDSDETILLKLLRGSHLSNLRGMEARSDGFDLSMHSSSTSSPKGYFAKPMLQLRKSDITTFLESNSLEWREDESNTSNKYKRNKVRNELMPLMRELAGGQEALQKRFSNIDQQSRSISKDLTERASSYLAAMPSQTEFWLPSEKVESFDLICEEAFYRLVTQLTDGELQLSYDQINRVKYQIENYPDRLQWTIDVGGLWSVQRKGNVLKLLHGNKNITHPVPWSIVEIKAVLYEEAGSTNRLFFSVPSSLENSTFVVKRLKDVGNVDFLPPWKKGRSPIKIKELLRGQKVPLHLREEAILLCLLTECEEKVIAIYLEANKENQSDRWITHSDFIANKGSVVIRVTLAKR